MKKDYHLHPTVDKYPAKFDLYVQNALSHGFDEVCITDHMPISCSNAGDRIRTGHVGDYCQTVRNIAKKYEGVLTVKCGIEIDYHPDYHKEIDIVLESGEFDYILGAIHLHVNQTDIFSKGLTHNEYAKKCLETTILAAQSGYFHAIAHLDLYRWIFTEPKRFPLTDDEYIYKLHWPLIEDTLYAIAEAGIRLEINPHLANITNKNIELIMPQREIVAHALKMGLNFCYGSDAHNPESLGVLYKAMQNDEIYAQALINWELEI